jgi:hypothetical protein
MSSYQQRSLAIHANLLAELRDLERLRERVKDAEFASLRKRSLQPKKPAQVRKSHRISAASGLLGARRFQ